MKTATLTYHCKEHVSEACMKRMVHYEIAKQGDKNRVISDKHSHSVHNCKLQHWNKSSENYDDYTYQTQLA